MRRSAVVLFFVGAFCAVAFGCLIAAYDIWGGVPRSLRPVAHALLVTAVVCVVAGAFRWVMSFPATERTRAIVKATLALGGSAVVFGGGLFAYYLVRWNSSRRICAPALVAPTRAEREAALKDGLGPLFPVIDPHSSCTQLERERIALERSGDCPTFVMDDAPCTCGREKWTGRTSPLRCQTGPTSCEARDLETGSYRQGLGCSDPDNWTLREARSYGGR